MSEPHCILHIGAPKCGSSALQTALTMTPDLQDGAGRSYRYVSCHPVGRLWSLLYGAEVQLVGRGSRYGYASWPNLSRQDEPAPLFQALAKTLRTGRDQGHVPILSCEGWIDHPGAFATALAEMGHPPVDVVAYLRPPVEWVNAAYWQWGIWHTPNLDTWLARSNMPYRFGMQLEEWARIPNVRLRIGRSRPDVVGRFSDSYGLQLPSGPVSNSSASPALVGLLLRNRKFRPSGHESSVEFVVQRWCPPVTGQKLWAVRARHVQQLRPLVAENWEALQRVASEEELADLRRDARWLQEKPYHAAINAGPTDLEVRSELAGLYEGLVAGLAQASATAGMAVPTVPGCPAETTALESWDAALCLILEALLEADRRVREQRGKAQARGLRQRLICALPRLRR